MADPAFEKVAGQVGVAERAILAALTPGAVWMCSGCNRPRERGEPFTGDALREQVDHLPYSSSVISIALMNLMERGVLVADSRWRLTVDAEALRREEPTT